MKIPKNIQKLIDKREQLAIDLMDTEQKLDQWLEKNGADFNDPDLTDCTITGCMIYAEPWEAKELVMNYIRAKL